MNPADPGNDGAFFIPGLILMVGLALFVYRIDRKSKRGAAKRPSLAKNVMPATPATPSEPPKIIWAYETGGVDSDGRYVEPAGIHQMRGQENLRMAIWYGHSHRKPLKSLDGGKTWVPAPEAGVNLG